MGNTERAVLPDGDFLIHAGDISNGYPDEVEDFLVWFEELPHPHKIFIGGNMDFPLAKISQAIRKSFPLISITCKILA